MKHRVFPGGLQRRGQTSYILALLLFVGLLQSGAFGQPAAVQGDPELHPYTVPLLSTPALPMDLRKVFNGPKGADLPRVTAEEGHFVAGGKRVRIWGVNLCFGGCFPPHEVADQLAAKLAAFGVNGVRFHHMDAQAFPNGLWKPDFSGLDPRSLDRLDYFLAALKREGIYANINLLVSRQLARTGANYPPETIPGQGKTVAIFDPELIDLQKAFARDFLTRVNPYTGLTYAEDPVVAIIEIANENTSFLSLSKHAQYLLPEPFATTFRDLWNAYLKDRYGNDASLRAAWGVEAEFLLKHEASLAAGNIPFFKRIDMYPGRRSEDFVDFLTELDRRFFTGMYGFLREELGVQSLITGTEGFTLPGDYVQSHLDFVDAHDYWQHPVFPGAAWDRENWHILNTAMVDEPAASTLLQLTFQRMLNPDRSGEPMPFTVSEYNHPAPNDHQAEAIPMLAAFAAAQDWDGLFHFAYSHSKNWDQDFVSSFFDIHGHPLKTIQLAAGALLFRRGDIQPLERQVHIHLPYDEMRRLGAIHLPWTDTILYGADLGAGPATRFSGRAAVASWEPPSGANSPTVISPATGREGSQPAESTSEGVFLRNETMSWRADGPRTGRFLAASERSLVGVGFHLDEANLGEQGFALRVASPDFAAVTVSPLDDEPLVQSRRILITTSARMENTAQAWNAARTTVRRNWGQGPTRIEPVVARIGLPREGGHTAVLHALDGDGRPLKSWTLKPEAGRLNIDLPGDPATLWYLLEVE